MTKNEIKEIIDYLKDKDDYIEELGIAYKRIFITNGDLKTLLDYITNLQEEKENADEAVEYWQEECDNLQQRIDKAVEYLEQPYRDNFDYSKAELLNILRGDE